jgi:hypothetical protein
VGESLVDFLESLRKRLLFLLSLPAGPLGRLDGVLALVEVDLLCRHSLPFSPRRLPKAFQFLLFAVLFPLLLRKLPVQTRFKILSLSLLLHPPVGQAQVFRTAEGGRRRRRGMRAGVCRALVGLAIEGSRFVEGRIAARFAAPLGEQPVANLFSRPGVALGGGQGDALLVRGLLGAPRRPVTSSVARNEAGAPSGKLTTTINREGVVSTTIHRTRGMHSPPPGRPGVAENIATI